MKAYEANQLSAAAFKRWWETDPENARAAIMQEILRPKPRFGAEVLGVLPERELPEVEQALADHLTLTSGNQEQVASLISRYASASVEPQVSDFLDPQVGKLACAIQTPLLAYFLRVDPTAAVSRLQNAMAARGAGYSACNHSLLVDVAGLHNDPVLQDMAIRSLDDDDPQVVANAASYLGRYGSARAEEPLWDRLATWSSQWKGREAELQYIPGENLDGVNRAEVGANLISALATAQGWLIDETKLNRLIDLSVGSDQRARSEQFLKSWQAQPRTIQFVAFGTGQFLIAQYNAQSLEAAIEKLRQFPGGSTFQWASDPKLDGEEKAFEDISKAVASQGIRISRSQSN